MSGRAVEAAGDVDTLAARQDRHHHARQSRRRPSLSRCRASARSELAEAAQLASLQRRDARRPLDRRAGQGEIRHARPRHGAACNAKFIPFSAQTRMSGIDCRRLLDPQGRGRCRAGLCQAQPTGNPTAPMRAVDGRSPNGSREPAARRLAVAKDGKLLGVIHLKDIVKGGIRERFRRTAPAWASAP